MVKYEAVMVVFMLFSAGLALYIASQGISVFQGSKNYTETVGMSPMDCVDYFYSVDNVSYDGYKLEFDVANNAVTGREIKSLVVKGVNSKNVEFSGFSPATERHVVVTEMKVNGSFSLYPVGCDVYAKVFSVEG